MEGQHSCSQFVILGAVDKVFHLAEALLSGADLVGGGGARQDVRGGNGFRQDSEPKGPVTRIIPR